MSGRFVLVTGANGGLGTFVTRKFLDAGDTVIGTSRKIQWSEFSNANFIPEPAELGDEPSVRHLADSAIQRFGRVDVLVHVAGGFAGGAPIHETDPKTWARMLETNLTSTYNVARAFIPHMRHEGRGRFIAVGSAAARRPLPNLGAYVVSKSALVTLVETIALENADRGITANLVLPGTMDTPANRAAMPSVDPRKWVSPADVANVIFWLASNEAGQTNGASIPVTGREP